MIPCIGVVRAIAPMFVDLLMKMLPPVLAERETGNSLGWIAQEMTECTAVFALAAQRVIALPVLWRLDGVGSGRRAIPRGSAAEGAKTPAAPRGVSAAIREWPSHRESIPCAGRSGACRTLLAPGIDPNRRLTQEPKRCGRRLQQRRYVVFFFAIPRFGGLRIPALDHFRELIREQMRRLLDALW